MSRKGDLDGRRFKPSIQKSRTRWRVQPTEAITDGKICIAAGVNTAGVYMTVSLATNASEASRRQTLYVAHAGTSDSSAPTLEVATSGLITGVDTSGGSIGDPVYLGTSGGFVLTAAGNERLIGRVLRAHATLGVIEFNGNLTNGATDEDFIAGTVLVANGATTGTVALAGWENALVVGSINTATTNSTALRSILIDANSVDVVLTADPGASGATVAFMAWKGTPGVTDA